MVVYDIGKHDGVWAPPSALARLLAASSTLEQNNAFVKSISSTALSLKRKTPALDSSLLLTVRTTAAIAFTQVADVVCPAVTGDIVVSGASGKDASCTVAIPAYSTCAAGMALLYLPSYIVPTSPAELSTKPGDIALLTAKCYTTAIPRDTARLCAGTTCVDATLAPAALLEVAALTNGSAYVEAITVDGSGTSRTDSLALPDPSSFGAFAGSFLDGLSSSFGLGTSTLANVGVVFLIIGLFAGLVLLLSYFVRRSRSAHHYRPLSPPPREDTEPPLPTGGSLRSEIQRRRLNQRS